MRPHTNLDEALAGLDLKPHGNYVFAPVQEIPADVNPFAVVREDEAITLILPEEDAYAAGIPVTDRYFRLTIGLLADLSSVGITATVAQILASRSISCNVVAGYYHDHIFVPANRSTEAIQILEELCEHAQGWLPEPQHSNTQKAAI